MKDLGIVTRFGFGYFVIPPEHIGKLMQIAGDALEVKYLTHESYEVIPDSKPFITEVSFASVVMPDDGGNAAEPIEPPTDKAPF